MLEMWKKLFIYLTAHSWHIYDCELYPTCAVLGIGYGAYTAAILLAAFPCK